MSKKYEFTDETITVDGHTLHRIRAVRCFSDVKAGEIGGWVEKEDNLSQMGDAWIGGDAKVCGNAKVYGNARVHTNAMVGGNARIYGDAQVYGNARIYGDAKVYDDAQVLGDVAVFGEVEICGNAVVCDGTDYIVLKNFWSSKRYFTWTKSNNMWKVGCFYGTGKELIEKAYKDSEKSGREYERIVRYVESILADEKNEKE